VAAPFCGFRYGGSSLGRPRFRFTGSVGPTRAEGSSAVLVVFRVAYTLGKYVSDDSGMVCLTGKVDRDAFELLDLCPGQRTSFLS
jgi:hypothetical protein